MVSSSSNISGKYDLTTSQLLIWTGQQLNPDSAMYNMAFAFEFNGDIDTHLFQKAFLVLVEKVDVLRARVSLEHSIPKLLIDNSFDYDFEVLDFTDYTSENINKSINERCKNVFNLEECLFDSYLIEKSDSEYIWVLNQHHLITDGWSKTVQFKVLSDIYGRLLKGETTDSIELPQYSDYILYEHSLKDKNKNAADYWATISSQIKTQDFPFISKTKTNTASVRKPCNLDSGTLSQLKEVVQDKGLRSWTVDISQFTVFTAVLSIILARRYQTDKITIGVPYLNRPTPDHKNTVGLFMEVFPMIVEVKRDDTFQSLYIRTRTSYFECLKYAGNGRSNIYLASSIPAIVNYMNGSFGALAGIPTSSRWIFVGDVDPGHILRLQVFDFDESGTMRISFDMNTSVFNTSQQDGIIDEFNSLVRSFINDRSQKIYGLTVTEQAVIANTNKVDVAYPKDKTLADLFEDQVAAHPHKIAVKDESGILTYSQLNHRSNKLANHLSSLGVEEGEMIAISLNRSKDIIVAILATIKLGCAYVPIDPDYPDERIRYTLDDAQVTWLIGESNVIQSHSTQEITSIDLATINWEDLSDITPNRKFPSDQALYVIYTSGSTGRPKGVVVSHKNVVRLFFNDSPLYDFNQNDVWTLFHSVCFDWSVWEMYGSLLTGGTLIIVPKKATTDPESYAQLLEENNVTILNQTPRVFYNLQSIFISRNSITKIRYVIFGGEALSPIRLKDWMLQYPDCRMINMYGITETTVHVTYKELSIDDIALGVSNIGTAIPTLECLILDDNLKEVPFGVVGEIHVGGAGLAKGYLNKEVLTKERFIPHPNRDGERLYKSGDLGMRLPDGDIKYIGRKDAQVKIRGHRIELGEIEASLDEYASVRQSAVIAHTDAQDNVRLIAYVVADAQTDLKSIEAYLERKLPTFMVPQAIINLPSMELTRNGKIDKSKLPEFDLNSLSNEDGHIPPVTEIEEFISEIWTNILGIENISVMRDFFRIGGDSLSAIRVMTSINDELELNLPVNLIFETTTIRNMAAHVEKTIKQLMEEMEMEENSNN